MRFSRVLLTLIPAIVAGVLIAGCGSSSSTSGTSSSSSTAGAPFLVLAYGGGTYDLNGTAWVEPCYEQDPNSWVAALMSFSGSTGTRTETTYGNDPSCSAQTGSSTFSFSVTNDGIQTGVGFTGTPPASITPPVDASKITIAAGDPGEFKSLMYVNTLATPDVLLMGDDSPSGVPDGSGYPTTLWSDGSVRQ